MDSTKGLDRSIDFRRPPTFRYTGPIIDAHCHSGWPRPLAHMIRAGRLYGVDRWVIICRPDEIGRLRRKYGSRLVFNVWCEHKRTGPGDPFTYFDHCPLPDRD